MIIKKYKHANREVILAQTEVGYRVTEVFDNMGVKTEMFFSFYNEADDHFSDLIEMNTDTSMVLALMDDDKRSTIH